MHSHSFISSIFIGFFGNKPFGFVDRLKFASYFTGKIEPNCAKYDAHKRYKIERVKYGVATGTQLFAFLDY